MTLDWTGQLRRPASIHVAPDAMAEVEVFRRAAHHALDAGEIGQSPTAAPVVDVLAFGRIRQVLELHRHASVAPGGVPPQGSRAELVDDARHEGGERDGTAEEFEGEAVAALRRLRREADQRAALDLLEQLAERRVAARRDAHRRLALDHRIGSREAETAERPA